MHGTHGTEAHVHQIVTRSGSVCDLGIYHLSVSVSLTLPRNVCAWRRELQILSGIYLPFLPLYSVSTSQCIQKNRAGPGAADLVRASYVKLAISQKISHEYKKPNADLLHIRRGVLCGHTQD
jgi:hypothetical protein